MRIIFPGRTYDEELVIAKCERLDITRTKSLMKTLRKIITKGPLKEHVLQARENAQHYIIRNSHAG